MKEENSTLKIDPNDVCQIPISELVNDANDSGSPLSIARPVGATNELLAFEKLAKIVSRVLFRLPYRADDDKNYVTFEDGDEKFDISSIRLSKDKDALLVRAFSEGGAMQKRLNPKDLRNRDPRTGNMLDGVDEPSSNDGADDMVTVYKASSQENQSSDVSPNKVEKKAKVGYEITWSDGAKFIYSQRAIAKAAGGALL